MGENPEIWKAVAMADHFPNIQKLPDPIPGCPNFRRVPGYKVTVVDNQLLLGLKSVLLRSVEISSQRMVELFG